MQEILQYLKLNGERLDSEIAQATGIPLAKVRLGMADLSLPRRRHDVPLDPVQGRQADRRDALPRVRIYPARQPRPEIESATAGKVKPAMRSGTGRRGIRLTVGLREAVTPLLALSAIA